jgi:hypothetical protein
MQAVLNSFIILQWLPLHLLLLRLLLLTMLQPLPQGADGICYALPDAGRDWRCCCLCSSPCQC